MREFDLMMEKYTRTVYNHGDNVSLRSTTRAWSATLSMMARYWFLPEVRAIHRAVVAALPECTYNELPMEDRRKLFELFGAESIQDLDVVVILRKAGIQITHDELDTFDIDPKQRTRFGVWDIVQVDSAVISDLIRNRLAKGGNDIKSASEVIWQRTIGDHPQVKYITDDIDAIETSRLEGDIYPAFSKIEHCFRVAKLERLTVYCDSVDDWGILARMARDARSLSALGFRGDLFRLFYKGMLVMTRTSKSAAETFVLEPGWTGKNRGLNSSVPVVSVTQPCIDRLAPDLFARSLDESATPFGAIVCDGKAVRWPSKATFGGAVFTSVGRTQPYTLGQNARVLTAQTWSRLTGATCVIADSTAFPCPYSVISSTSKNRLYPCSSSLMTAGYEIPGAGKYSPYAMDVSSKPICLRLSSNGPGVGRDNLRHRLISEAQRIGFDAGIYRLDVWERSGGGSPSSAHRQWEPLMKPKVDRESYFQQEVVILADGFGAPYELHPLLHHGVKVVVVGSNVQYCEAFCSGCFVKIADLRDLSDAIAKARALDPMSIRESAQRASAAIRNGTIVETDGITAFVVVEHAVKETSGVGHTNETHLPLADNQTKIAPSS